MHRQHTRCTEVISTEKRIAMHKIQIKFRNWALLIATLCVVSTGLLVTSCEGKEEEDTKVVLQSFGPMPIARGAELKFIGLNLDKVTSVVLPNDITITTFTKKEPTLLTLTVPQEAMPGYVTLKTPDGDITTKTTIGFSEPISIASFTPATVKAGDVLTITGDYLNLVSEVILSTVLWSLRMISRVTHEPRSSWRCLQRHRQAR